MISSLAFPSGLVTDVGGPPGFSGTEYVDYLKRLSVIHVGSYSNEEINEFPEQRLSSYKKGCRQGTALSIAGKGDYIDGCMELIKLGRSNATDNGVTAKAVAQESKCMDGWKILTSGSLSSSPPWVLHCIDLFAGRNVSEADVEECVHGWSSISRDESYILLCLNFVNSPFDIEVATLCRNAWYRDNLARAHLCEKFVTLSARNPRARGIAAWVLNDRAFHFVDRDTIFSHEC